MNQNRQKNAFRPKAIKKCNHFIKRRLFLFLILLAGSICLIAVGCADLTRLIVPDEGPIRISGIKFKTQSLPSNTNPAFTYYVGNSDEIYVNWTQFILLIGRNDDAVCTFSLSSTTDDCYVLNLCTDIDDGESLLVVGGVDLQIIAFPEFMRSDNPDLIVSEPNITPSDGCVNEEAITGIFTPEKSGVYRIDSPLSKAENFLGETNGEINLHVIGTDQNPKQTVAYDLTKETSTDYWVWEMPDADLWEANFSKNLRIESVRILNGNRTIRPSRTFFLPNYNGTIAGNLENANECFSNVNTPDDDSIFLGDCKKSPNANANTDPQKNITPTYDHNLTGDKLTWFAEFNTQQGGDDLGNATNLKIEFTLEVVN